MRVNKILVIVFFLIGNSIIGFAQNLPLQLWYNQPASKWTDALPIGNGSLGAMVFGGVANEHIQFNESTLWTGGPRVYQRNGASQYLDAIRQLLFQENQPKAEALAEKHFMGLKDKSDSLYSIQKKQWEQSLIADKRFAKVDYDDHAWPTMELPTANGWEQAGLAAIDGSVWFRINFNLPSTWVGQNLKIDLGRIRDLDYTYINGQLIGSSEGITNKRSYTINAAILKPGKNTIAIQVLNYFDKGGLIGIKENRPVFVVYPSNQPSTSGLQLSTTWKYFIQNTNPPSYPQYEASYQPFGDIYFQMTSDTVVSNYKRTLDISRAISTVNYTSNQINFTRTYFASNPHKALVMKFSADKLHAINLRAKFGSAHQGYIVSKINDKTISLQVKVKNGALKAVALLYVNTIGGTVSVIDNQLALKNVTEANFYLVAATNFKNYQNVSANPMALATKYLANLNHTSYPQINKAHITDYQKQFFPFSIRFGNDVNDLLPTDERIKQFSAKADPNFLALYVQYARYLLIACSPSNANQPANLQGIWNDLLTPPWGSKFTTNINTEMNYWSAEQLHLSASINPLFRAIKELSIAGQKTAKAHYAANGWVLHHNTDLWRGTAPINASNHGIWVSGAAWMCLPIWEHFLYTQDTAFLKNNFPIMKSAALFFTQFLVKDKKTGWLISTPSNSPENGGLVAGPTMDHQIIRELFKNTVAASNILGIDKQFANQLANLSQQIAPNQIGQYQQLQEWLQDKDDTANKHRHVSHLWGVYPGTDISFKTPSMMQAAKQSLLYRGDEGTGWSLAWKVNLWARFKEGDHAMSLAEKLLSPAEDINGISEKGGVYKNMFDAHPPFQIDGNFGGAAGITEMLAQSHMGYIDLLPALPNVLPDGLMKGLCARGGFELELEWKNHQLVQVKILSTAANHCYLKYGNKQIDFNTQKGKSYQLNANLQMQ